jgi:hypothetical protein
MYSKSAKIAYYRRRRPGKKIGKNWFILHFTNITVTDFLEVNGVSC